MNNIYIYNGKFKNLLLLIKNLTEHKVNNIQIKEASYTPNLFDNIINLKLEDNVNIINYFKKKIGHQNFSIIFHVFLSHNENKENIIFYFILNAIKYQDKTRYHLNLKCVNLALKINKKVCNENHKFKEFTRFQELENHIYSAIITPENKIIFLLAHHFKNRLSSEYFIIHDTNNHIICIYDKNKLYYISDKNIKTKKNISKDEDKIKAIWKTFYENITIKERKNEKLRMNNMPKKYWKNITEMESEL